MENSGALDHSGLHRNGRSDHLDCGDRSSAVSMKEPFALIFPSFAWMVVTALPSRASVKQEMSDARTRQGFRGALGQPTDDFAANRVSRVVTFEDRSACHHDAIVVR
jgi:hypothetical protein